MGPLAMCEVPIRPPEALDVRVPGDLAKLKVVLDNWRNPGEGAHVLNRAWLAALLWLGVPHLCAEDGS